MTQSLEETDSKALTESFLFEGVDSAAMQSLHAMAQARSFAAGERLFTQGQLASHFFLVVAGQVALSRSAPNGEEKIIEINGPGQTFAEALMFMGGPRYPVNCQALAESRVLAIPNRPFLDMIGASPTACFRLLANLSVRLHRLVNEIESLTLQSAKVRFVNFLLSLAPEDAVGAVEVRLPYSKQVIASRLSIKPETLSRILSDLDARDRIRVQGAHITIPDLGALRHIATS